MENNNLTAVEWLESEIKKIRNIIPKVLFEQAKQMEQEQLENARPQIISNCVIKEIADDEIKRKIKKEYIYSNYQDRHWMEEGAKWYREKIKKQQ